MSTKTKPRQQKRLTTAETARRKRQHKNCRKMQKTNFTMTKSKQNEINQGENIAAAK